MDIVDKLLDETPWRVLVSRKEAADEIARLRTEVEAMRVDAERLDWLDKSVTMVSDSERYLPRRVYWGGGTNKNVRQAIDAARGKDDEQI